MIDYSNISEINDIIEILNEAYKNNYYMECHSFYGSYRFNGDGKLHRDIKLRLSADSRSVCEYIASKTNGKYHGYSSEIIPTDKAVKEMKNAWYERLKNNLDLFKWCDSLIKDNTEYIYVENDEIKSYDEHFHLITSISMVKEGYPAALHLQKHAIAMVINDYSAEKYKFAFKYYDDDGYDRVEMRRIKYENTVIPTKSW